MPVHLLRFPLLIQPNGGRISFHEGFQDLRHGVAHQAIDIGAPRGTTIVSTTNGTVLRQWVTQRDRRQITGCGWSDRGGFIVIILDPSGYAHYYAHMQGPPLVNAGSIISAGTQIGHVSNTGSAARGGSAHLHYQIWPIGANRDAEWESGIFTRPFGRSVDAFSELRRLAESLGARIGTSSVIFGESRSSARTGR